MSTVNGQQTSSATNYVRYSRSVETKKTVSLFFVIKSHSIVEKCEKNHIFVIYNVIIGEILYIFAKIKIITYGIYRKRHYAEIIGMEKFIR